MKFFLSLIQKITMIIDNNFLDSLCEQAKNNPRLRINHDLRNSDKDLSQRMLNALHPGTMLPIHRHPSTSETMIVIKGSVTQKFYDEDGKLTESYILKAGSNYAMVHIPAGMWHNLECLEEGTVIFEAKDGAYQPVKEEDIKNNI